MEAYATVVRVSTTTISSVAAVSHLLVAILSQRRAKADHSAYICLMQIYSLICALRVVTAWMVIYRAQDIDNTGHTIIFSYGVASQWSTLTAGTILSISSQMGFSSVLLLPICMGSRALILYGKSVTKVKIVIVCAAVKVLAMILLTLNIEILIKSQVVDVTAEFMNENQEAPAIAELKNYWEIQLWYTGSNSTYICVPITFGLRYLMVKKLKSFHIVSERTSNLHNSFIKLLSLEASILCIGILVTILRFFSRELDYPMVAIYLSAFSLPILLSMHMFEGIATLLLVPYLRAAICWPFMRKHNPILVKEHS